MSDNTTITAEKIDAARAAMVNRAVDKMTLDDTVRGLMVYIYADTEIVSFVYHYTHGRNQEDQFIPLGTSADTTIGQAYEIIAVFAEMRKHRMDLMREAMRFFTAKIKEGWQPELKRPDWDKRVVN